MSAQESRTDRSGERPVAAKARERARMVVTGVVQGVGFRWFVLERARALGLDGTVRNRPDGTVAIDAVGSREALARLVHAALYGPPLARVREVRVRWDAAGDASDTAPGFHVVR